MQSENNTSAPTTPRLRHRRRSNEVCLLFWYIFFLSNFNLLSITMKFASKFIPYEKAEQFFDFQFDFVNYIYINIFQLGCQAIPDATKANGSHLLVHDRNKYKSFLVRAYSTVWMIAGFVLIVYMGHLYITAMVVVIQIFMARELFNLLRKAHEERDLPGFRMLNW